MLDIRKLNARGSNLMRYQVCITTDPVPATAFLPYQLWRASGLDGSNLNQRQHDSWVEHNPACRPCWKPWSATPLGWTHSRLGEIWFCNEGIRSWLRNSEPGGGYHFVGCAAVANQLAATWMWLAGAIPLRTFHSNSLLCFVILRNLWYSLGNI